MDAYIFTTSQVIQARNISQEVGTSLLGIGTLKENAPPLERDDTPHIGISINSR
jgi:hypothetical protein